MEIYLNIPSNIYKNKENQLKNEILNRELNKAILLGLISRLTSERVIYYRWQLSNQHKDTLCPNSV